MIGPFLDSSLRAKSNIKGRFQTSIFCSLFNNTALRTKKKIINFYFEEVWLLKPFWQLLLGISSNFLSSSSNELFFLYCSFNSCFKFKDENCSHFYSLDPLLIFQSPRNVLKNMLLLITFLTSMPYVLIYYFVLIKTCMANLHTLKEITIATCTL